MLQAGQVAFGWVEAVAAAAAAPAAATTCGDGASTATVAANEGADVLATSEVPHILQKFMPGGLTVPHALHAVPAFSAVAGAEASSFWPQSWQNNEPSRFTFPQ